MRNYIQQLDVLVHPDFTEFQIGDKPLHPKQQEIRAGWDNRILDLSSMRNGFLVYVSAMMNHDLSRALSGSAAADLTPAQAFDFARIQRYHNIMEGRMFVCANFDALDPLPQQLNESNLAVNGSTNVLAYGEWLGHCASGFGESVLQVLQLPKNNLIMGRANLGLSEDEYRKIKMWKEQQR
jgi:hypothetical protein